MSVLVVGSVALDDIRTPSGHAPRVLGGSASYFSLAARVFAPVRIVAVVGEDFPTEHLSMLAGRGIDVTGVAREPGESFFWAGSYDADLKQATTHETRLGVFETFAPVLSADQRRSPYVFLANIDPELQASVLDQVSDARLVVMDTMNFWIQGKRPALERVLPRVDVVLVNDEELALLTGDHDVIRASRTFLESDFAPRRGVVIKKGANGALLRTRDDLFAMPAFPTECVVDPTGAGDTFAGGFVGHVAARDATDSGVLREATARGIAMASFTVEAFSTDRLARVTPAELTTRLDMLRDMTRIDVPSGARVGR